MQIRWNLLILALVLVLWPGASPLAEGKRDVAIAMLDARFEGEPERLTLPLGELVAQATLTPEQDFRVIPVGRDPHSSHHTVAIRRAEDLHRHDDHDLMVVILRGHGTMQLGKERRPVGEGSILYIPRGTPHAFENASDRPAVAYAVYHPPYAGRDRIPVD